MIPASIWLLAVSAALLLCVFATAARGAGPHVDASLFPGAYGVLADERLMYPVDMSDWPVKITCERQLFLDDYLIARRSNVTRQVHPPTRHPGNPVLRLWEKPWEHGYGHSLWVLRDEKTERFRMWYNFHHRIEGEDSVRYRAPTCYATSEDGVHWTKPNLGIWKTGGSSENNISLLQGTIDGLFYEPDDPDPNRRYKALVWHDPGDQGYAPHNGFYLYVSPDGLLWTGDRTRCIMPHGKGGSFPAQPISGVGDTTNFRWDAKLRRYICNAKVLFRDPDTLRTAGQCESDDLIHWTRPRMTLHRDGLDEPGTQMYEHTTFPYESMWIGLLRVMHGQKGVVPKPPIRRRRPGWKQVEVELTASRDGRHWTRVCRGRQFLPLGGMNSWDADYRIPSRPGKPLEIDGKLWFYYWGARRPERFKAMGRPNPRIDMHVGLAKLRIDGFVSLNAGVQPGTVVTRPLTFEGGTLHLNATVAPGGRIRVAVQNTAGAPLPHYTLAASKPITGDALDTKVTWSSRKTIRHNPSQSLRLVFELERAELYSLWID